MHRLALVLLLVAALLLATSLGAPAAPTRAPAPFAPPPALLDEQASAVLSEVNAEVQQLRQRLATPPAAPVPERDPFTFGGRPMPDAVVPDDVITPIAPPPPLVLPRLVGIASSGDDGEPTRRAFVAFDDRVREVSVGDTLGPFTVRAVYAQSVELVHTERGTAHSISIR